MKPDQVMATAKEEVEPASAEEPRRVPRVILLTARKGSR